MNAGFGIVIVLCKERVQKKFNNLPDLFALLTQRSQSLHRSQHTDCGALNTNKNPVSVVEVIPFTFFSSIIIPMTSHYRAFIDREIH